MKLAGRPSRKISLVLPSLLIIMMMLCSGQPTNKKGRGRRAITAIRIYVYKKDEVEEEITCHPLK